MFITTFDFVALSIIIATLLVLVAFLIAKIKHQNEMFLMQYVKTVKLEVKVCDLEVDKSLLANELNRVKQDLCHTNASLDDCIPF